MESEISHVTDGTSVTDGSVQAIRPIRPIGHMPIHAAHGSKLSCKGWQQEAAMRMLMNNLDPDVAERPEELIVYGGSGKAARNWECYDAIVRELQSLGNDETLLVQSGKPVGVLKTYPDAPRVVISNSQLVPHWATWDEFRRLEHLGLTMFGQMTAGSWIYIGSQGIVQGTFETLMACAKKHFNGSLKGKIVLTAGLGGMGGAQPLAATMAGAAFLGVEIDEARIQKRIASGYCDRMTNDLNEALEIVTSAKERGEAISVALLGNAAGNPSRISAAWFHARYCNRPNQRARCFEWILSRRIYQIGSRRPSQERSGALYGGST